MLHDFAFPLFMPFIGLFSIAAFVFWIWAIIDCIKSEKRTEEKLIWVLLILLLNFIGALIYAIIGRGREEVFRVDNNKKLTRSREDRVIAGVCGGLAEYFGTSSAMIRLIWILILVVSAGTGLIAYIIAAVVIPEKEESKKSAGKRSGKKSASESNDNNGPLLLVIVLFLVLFFSLLGGIFFMNGFPAMVSIHTQEASESISVSEKIAEHKLPSDDADAVAERIRQSSEFEDVMDLRLIRSEDSPDGNSYSFLFNTAEGESFLAEAKVRDDEIVSITYDLVDNKEERVDDFVSCANAGNEVLEPDCSNCSLQCITDDGRVFTE
ncbi:MAG: PspC domain-containing protein [Nanobdellota archaeon]